jgi:hypothetical protein
MTSSISDLDWTIGSMELCMYVCETWSVTFEEHRMRVFENRRLRIFGPKRDEMR